MDCFTITEGKKATEGKKEMAEEQARHAGLLRAALAEEEGAEPARAHAQRAQQGWLAVADGGRAAGDLLAVAGHGVDSRRRDACVEAQRRQGG